jgi:hypothetical protein
MGLHARPVRAVCPQRNATIGRAAANPASTEQQRIQDHE